MFQSSPTIQMSQNIWERAKLRPTLQAMATEPPEGKLKAKAITHKVYKHKQTCLPVTEEDSKEKEWSDNRKAEKETHVRRKNRNKSCLLFSQQLIFCLAAPLIERGRPRDPPHHFHSREEENEGKKCIVMAVGLCFGLFVWGRRFSPNTNPIH